LKLSSKLKKFITKFRLHCWWGELRQLLFLRRVMEWNRSNRAANLLPWETKIPKIDSLKLNFNCVHFTAFLPVQLYLIIKNLIAKKKENHKRPYFHEFLKILRKIEHFSWLQINQLIARNYSFSPERGQNIQNTIFQPHSFNEIKWEILTIFFRSWKRRRIK